MSEIDLLFAQSKPGSSEQGDAENQSTLKTAAKKRKSKKNNRTNEPVTSARQSPPDTSSQKTERQPSSQDASSQEGGSSDTSESSEDSDGAAVIVDPSISVAQQHMEQKRSERALELSEQDEHFADSRGKRKRTEEGFPVYTYDELQIGTGGGTELCPFDCNCCF